MSDRIYWRYRKNGRYCYSYDGRPAESELNGATPRAWLDARDFDDVGGKREPLVPVGKRYATDDEDLAEDIAAERIRELKKRRLLGQVADVSEPKALGPFAEYHLKRKKKVEDCTDQWLKAVQRHLQDAVEFLGSTTGLMAIKVSNLEDWVVALRERPESEGGPLSDASIRKRLNSLSNLFRRAQAEEAVPPHFNPVRSMEAKPQEGHHRAQWLEVPTAAALLEAARLEEPGQGEIPFPYELLATFLLTGGRKSEVLGLQVSDLDFDARTVSFEPNQWRRLKSRNSNRVVPMPEQLAEILRPYVFGDEAKLGLLFPSPVTGKMLHDVRLLWDRLAKRVGLEKGHVRCHGLRHTYCAACLQLIDRGQPISEFTVASWMGHSDAGLIKRRYGHLGRHRHRSTELEFCVENHIGELEADVVRELQLAS